MDSKSFLFVVNYLKNIHILPFNSDTYFCLMEMIFVRNINAIITEITRLRRALQIHIWKLIGTTKKCHISMLYEMITQTYIRKLCWKTNSIPHLKFVENNQAIPYLKIVSNDPNWNWLKQPCKSTFQNCLNPSYNSTIF